MATTRIMSMHVNKGCTVAQCLSDRTEYAKNPDKTADGELVSSYACDPKTVDTEFLLAKTEYHTITGRSQRSDVIAYQVRQSFKPGEVTPEEANQIGYELAMRFLKGKHAFIVATHIDRKHVHNHIIWNSTTLDCKRKFRDFLGSGRAVAKLSDTICLEHGLSIVETSAHRGKGYGQWLGDGRKIRQRDLLRMAIDDALAANPGSLEALLKLLVEQGWEMKCGKHIALRGQGQKNFLRLDSLGDGYTQKMLEAVLAGKQEHIPMKKAASISSRTEKVSLLVDIQAKLQQGKSAGYERWAKVFNLKQMANTLNYLSEHNLLSYDDLKGKTDAAVSRHAELSQRIKDSETRLAEIAMLKTQIINYHKTKGIFAEYKRSGYSKRFIDEHSADIQLCRAAKKAFNELGLTKLPTVHALNIEYAEVLEQKKKAYGEYRRARTEMRELLAVRANVDRIMGQEQEREQDANRDRDQT